MRRRPSTRDAYPVNEHGAPSGEQSLLVRRRRLWGLLGPAAALLVVLLLSAPALAANSVSSSVIIAASDHYVWKAPYDAYWGLLSKSHRDTSGCGVASHGPTFANPTGDVELSSRPFEAVASACPNADTFSVGLTTQVLYILMPNFTASSSGAYKVDAAWKGGVKVSLAISGTNCSGDLGYADLAIALYLIDSTTDKVTWGDGWNSSLYHESVPVSDNSSTDLKETKGVSMTRSLGGSLQLTKGDLYSVDLDVLLYAFVQVANPISGVTNHNPPSCSASAEIIPDSGSEVAELVDVVVA